MAQQMAQGDRQPIERNLAMELVSVTEAAAMAAVQHMGKGDKEMVDQAAVDAMRHTLGGISMDGIVVIGEGEKDEAPMLYNGERIGDGSEPPGRHRRRPHRRHDAALEGPAGRHRRDRHVGARHHERAARGLLHGQDRGRPGGPRRDRHQRAGGGEPAAASPRRWASRSTKSR